MAGVCGVPVELEVEDQQGVRSCKNVIVRGGDVLLGLERVIWYSGLVEKRSVVELLIWVDELAHEFDKRLA